jgi:hypothetical protein
MEDVFMQFTISANSLIRKFFLEHHLDTIYNQSVIRHLISFLIAMALKGFSGKITDVAEVSTSHRTTLSRFLSENAWDEKPLQELNKKTSFQYIQKRAVENGTPIFVSIDDTVNCKTKPSSKAKHPIQGTGFHHSHLLKKQVWGHQVVAIMLSCGGKEALNIDVHRYDKTVESKIAYVQRFAKKMPKPEMVGYALGDSWYTNAKIINAFAESGYYYIGALKTNRIIYPEGKRINIVNFADQMLVKDDFDPVTVKGSQYCAYRYEGELNGIPNAAVVITVPYDGFDANGKIKNLKSVKAFLCTDTTLDTVTILEYYTKRWCIEVFFKQMKGVGFNKYQIRSIMGIERLWLLMSLCHLICSIGLDTPMQFGTGLRFLRESISEEQKEFIYKCAQNNIALEDINIYCA